MDEWPCPGWMWLWVALRADGRGEASCDQAAAGPSLAVGSRRITVFPSLSPFSVRWGQS